MKRALIRWTAAGALGLLAACAFITVNVYFPEKDVKQAYKSLDEMLLQQKVPSAPEETPPGGEPKVQGEKPVSLLPSFRLVPAAFAQEDLAGRLAREVAGIPEVQKAYEEMRARMPQLNALRDSGVVGEAMDGRVVLRDQSRAADAKAVVDAENGNRKTIITNMAKAILRINNQPETKDNLQQVLGKAAATYADTKRDEAKPGWWIQNAAGRWVQK